MCQLTLIYSFSCAVFKAWTVLFPYQYWGIRASTDMHCLPQPASSEKQASSASPYNTSTSQTIPAVLPRICPKLSNFLNIKILHICVFPSHTALSFTISVLPKDILKTFTILPFLTDEPVWYRIFLVTAWPCTLYSPIYFPHEDSHPF